MKIGDIVTIRANNYACFEVKCPRIGKEGTITGSRGFVVEVSFKIPTCGKYNIPCWFYNEDVELVQRSVL